MTMVLYDDTVVKLITVSNQVVGKEGHGKNKAFLHFLQKGKTGNRVLITFRDLYCS